MTNLLKLSDERIEAFRRNFKGENVVCAIVPMVIRAILL